MEKLFDINGWAYYLRSDGLVYHTMLKHRTIELEDAKEALIVCEKLSEITGDKLWVISDIRNLRGLSTEARILSEQEGTFNKFIYASSVIVKSSISKMIGNFYVRISKTPYPTKLFKDEDMAAAWLHQLKEQQIS